MASENIGPNKIHMNIERDAHVGDDAALAARLASIEGVLADRVSITGELSARASVLTDVQSLGDPIPDPSFGKALLKAAKHVICVAWTVPAVRNQLVTLLVRFGLPGSLVAIGMAVGEKLAQ